MTTPTPEGLPLNQQVTALYTLLLLSNTQAALDRQGTNHAQNNGVVRIIDAALAISPELVAFTSAEDEAPSVETSALAAYVQSALAILGAEQSVAEKQKLIETQDERLAAARNHNWDVLKLLKEFRESLPTRDLIGKGLEILVKRDILSQVRGISFEEITLSELRKWKEFLEANFQITGIDFTNSGEIQAALDRKIKELGTEEIVHLETTEEIESRGRQLKARIPSTPLAQLEMMLQNDSLPDSIVDAIEKYMTGRGWVSKHTAERLTEYVKDLKRQIEIYQESIDRVTAEKQEVINEQLRLLDENYRQKEALQRADNLGFTFDSVLREVAFALISVLTEAQYAVEDITNSDTPMFSSAEIVKKLNDRIHSRLFEALGKLLEQAAKMDGYTGFSPKEDSWRVEVQDKLTQAE